MSVVTPIIYSGSAPNWGFVANQSGSGQTLNFDLTPATTSDPADSLAVILLIQYNVVYDPATGPITPSQITATFDGIPGQIATSDWGYTGPEHGYNQRGFCVCLFLIPTSHTFSSTSAIWSVSNPGLGGLFEIENGLGFGVKNASQSMTLNMAANYNSTLDPTPFAQNAGSVSANPGDLVISFITQSNAYAGDWLLSSTDETYATTFFQIEGAGGYGFANTTGFQTESPTWTYAPPNENTPLSGPVSYVGLFTIQSVTPLYEVPNLIGLSSEAASAAITGAGFVVGATTSQTGGAADSVIAQSPAAGSPLAAGSAVNYTYTIGYVVPNVIGVSAAVVAPEILTASDFIVGNITYESNVLVLAGNVIRQSPIAGSHASPGSGINLVVSTGRGGVIVPDVLGETVPAATAAANALGLSINTVTSAPSQLYPAGDVIAQNPSGGTPVASGSFVSLVVSSGPPVPGESFDFEATVISQYANSPTILQLCQSMNNWLDQTANFANFYSFVWNVDTAEGFGLDIWGKIVNVSRLLTVDLPDSYVGFNDGTGGPGSDYQTFGPGGDGTFYNAALAFEQYTLSDSSYRTLILAKAFANLMVTTIPSLNQLLQNIFPGRGNAYMTQPAPMQLVINLDFTPTAVELAILNNSGVFPTPPGCSLSISST